MKNVRWHRRAPGLYVGYTGQHPWEGVTYHMWQVVRGKKWRLEVLATKVVHKCDTLKNATELAERLVRA